DVAHFNKIIHTTLKDSVTGYVMQLRQDGKLRDTLIWNWGRTPTDGDKVWTENTRMHLASVSKLLTAIGMVKTLDARKISYDAKIIHYLPTYWKKGKNIDKITFRHLMTHTSGFNTPSSDSDYLYMKGKVAAGVAKVGSYAYQNMNFGLCRILIPIIRGEV